MFSREADVPEGEVNNNTLTDKAIEDLIVRNEKMCCGDLV